MNVIPLLIPLARSQLKTMTNAEKINVLNLVKNVADILLTGDPDLIGVLLDSLDVDQKVRDLILTEFSHVNETK